MEWQSSFEIVPHKVTEIVVFGGFVPQFLILRICAATILGSVPIDCKLCTDDYSTSFAHKITGRRKSVPNQHSRSKAYPTQGWITVRRTPATVRHDPIRSYHGPADMIRYHPTTVTPRYCSVQSGRTTGRLSYVIPGYCTHSCLDCEMTMVPLSKAYPVRRYGCLSSELTSA